MDVRRGAFESDQAGKITVQGVRILSLAEADSLDGFRFYERQGKGVG